jgi:transcriptional regulator with XRE-family HTH domain
MKNKKIRTTADLEKAIGPLTFGRVLKAWRLCEELSQKDLAKRLRVSRYTLAKLESGRRVPSLKCAEKIAKKMGAMPQQWVRLALQDYINKSGVDYSIKVEVA